MKRRLSYADGALFGSKPAVQFCDPKLPEEAKPRLSRQCELILERLKQGPASNDELCRLTRNHSGRISDLRKSGWKIQCYDLNHATGLSWYRLLEE